MNNLSGATTAVFIVSLSAALEVPVNVAWQTKDGTAKAGTDYEAATGSVTFEVGETQKQIQVVVYGREAGDTAPRKFSILLYPPENAILDQTLTEVEIQVTDSEGVAVTSLVVATGPRGLKGDPGLSAYALAKLQGYTGTLEEWLESQNPAAAMLQKTLRVSESSIPMLPIAGLRRNRIIAFDNNGDPMMVLPESGSAADVIIELAKPTGAGKSGLLQGGAIQDAVQYLTPEMFYESVVDDDWSQAFVSAGQKSIETGMPVYGFGKTYKIGAAITITAHELRDMTFVPTASYSGAAPDVYTPTTTGKVKLSNITFDGFKARGARVRRGLFTGQPVVDLHDVKCRNNGSILRTTITTAINTASNFVIPVADATGFAANNAIWIGDSKCLILSIAGNNITLVNDGTKPTLQPGGTGSGTYRAGQYFTKDGDGKNGLTIGDGGPTYTVNVTGCCEFNGNAWFGMFNWANDAPPAGSSTKVAGATALDNGYIGLGLGKQLSGSIIGCTVGRNGNNGIDINKATSAVTISFNEAFENGVDGIFTGSYKTTAKTFSNTVYDNFRIGILYSGDSVGTIDAISQSNTVRGNPLYGICMTGVKDPKVTNNVFDGVCSQHVKVEGRNGSPNPNPDVSDNTFVTEGTSYDIFGVLGGYTDGGSPGKANLINNTHAVSKPKINISSFDRQNSRFQPEFYVVPVSPGAAAAAAAISVSLTAYQPYNTETVDITATLTHLQLATSASGTTVDTATAVRTAGLELANSAAANGKIIAGYQFGTLSYNITAPAAAVKYLHYNSGGKKGYVQLTWS